MLIHLSEIELILVDEPVSNSTLSLFVFDMHSGKGPRYRLQELRFEGNQIFGDKILSESIEFEPGRFYSGSTVEELRRSLVRIYQERSDRIPAVAAQLLSTGETELAAAQLSQRGGRLYCELRGSRVFIGGHTKKYLQGEISV